MKLFSKEQIYEGDKLTTERQNISSTDLMERAGTQIFNWIHMRMQGVQVPIHVFCGIGNNGGDGLVLARHLITHGYNVITYIVNCSDKRSKDFLINYDRIKNVTKDWPKMLTCQADFPEFHPDDIIVDAVFGIGLNRPPNDWVTELFQRFRASKAFTLAIDIPSGVYTDKAVEDENAVVHANYTLSFQSPKLIFFLPETAKYTVQWEVLDIGIDRDYLMQTDTEVELISKFEVLPFYKPREKFSHKGDFGHVMILGGSYGKIGAVNLASSAALSSGAGLVTAYIPKCGYHSMQAALPEVMVITDENEKTVSHINYDIEPSVIGVGVGLGTSIETAKAFESFLKEYKTPLVIDADGINLLSKKKALLKSLPELTVLTPHPKELERLVGKWSDDFEKLKKVKAFSKKYNVIVLIKGANSITVYQDKLYINTTGNPGLATAGSGDVLTGIISGLIAQKYEPLSATIFGVYLHGKSADISVEDYGYQGLVASHIIVTIGEAYIDLFKKPEQPAQQEEAQNK
ncbi:bifunctional ADP-dependent NAD(P)H-hydrate dehydratase/NAD(P)H-hydrate epimerase [Winogradskyella sp. PG-2]|uniref:bifunctional ADP-dependent NAD(P)H-hydrate dehydratase/NAD(P)H-hydrate epimerase n=1 Tax=Winogradskyella sp. PG-2 TaxID=754409 RepID=UPI0004588C35|nr:bifunctional ADP-dependent NAD(P)H-hydrate dehydratase/NAD(P)H-hydrate epimerase [Winogradskyella sp. PG-2]BAO77554.1 NAD(P)HX epimerase / NAD(P)HX dehydratase [Winogradskyella sp. PG-2]